MARNCEGDRKRQDWRSDQDGDQEDEALSFSDLPLDLLDDEDNQLEPDDDDQEPQNRTELEEFDFGSCGGSVLEEQEMCAADEVFSNGQILPLRLSFSSNPSRSVSRSASMDHSSGLTSRSSSINSSSTGTNNYKKLHKPNVHSQFHTHPSPKPQIRVSGPRAGRKSSVWDFFRLGLVPTPEIELHDLKLRAGNYTSFGGSSSSSSSSSRGGSIKKSKNLDLNKKQDQEKPIKKDGIFDKSRGFFRGCKCSVATVPLNTVIVKNSSKNERTRHRGQGKHGVSRHRTFEWVKDLSRASSHDHQMNIVLA